MTETKKTSIVALVIESVIQILSPENRDQGSIFSHEIRASEAAGVIATIIRKSFKKLFFFAVKRFWVKFTDNCRTTMT